MTQSWASWAADYIRRGRDKDLREWRRTWNKKQKLAAYSGARFYGDGGTIHGTGELDICMTPDGIVTQVWFRCQMLPFRVSVTRDREPVSREQLPIITGVEVVDPAREQPRPAGIIPGTGDAGLSYGGAG